MTTFSLAEWIFLTFFAALHLGYFVLITLSLFRVRRHTHRRAKEQLPEVFAGYEPSISAVVPTYNMADTILATIRALIGQQYEALQVVVVNDGSTDDTMDRVIEAHDMVPLDLPPRSELISKPIKRIYRSTGHQDILLIDKENGRKADAINAGLNYVRHARVCVMDADSVLDPESVRHGARMFIERPETIATGGTISVLNGCRIGANGFVDRIGLAGGYLERVQTVEYVRVFRFGRLGWATMNALPIISGAFSMFDREALVKSGGFRTDTIGEDMEVTLRLHRYGLKHREKYRIDFAPEVVCWTEVPESWIGLQQQRIRWHQGLSESLSMNRGLLLKPSIIGSVALPFTIVFEWLSPFIEMSGYLFALTAYAGGFLSEASLFAFMFMAIGLGILLSITSIAMEEIAVRTYPKFRQVLILCVYAVLENIGFRQMHAAWRCIGLMRWAWNRKQQW